MLKFFLFSCKAISKSALWDLTEIATVDEAELFCY